MYCDAKRPCSLIFALSLVVLLLVACQPVQPVDASAAGAQDSQASSVADNGLVTNQSDFSVDETVSRLQSILEEKGLTVFLVVDHAANAANAGLELLPTVLVLTGNPNLGTPLMQSNPTIGLDLPQKFLVWEDAAGDVFITYNAPEYLAQRHNITDQDEVFGKITGALNAFATASATSE